MPTPDERREQAETDMGGVSGRNDVGTEFVHQVDNPDQAGLDLWETELAQSGVDTPGCDCGHHGMGPRWHAMECAWRAAKQPVRTTPDNSPTSGDTPDNSLREQIQAAIESEVYEFRERTMWWPEGEITKEIARLATRGAMEIRDRELEQLRAKVAEFDHIINWHTTCASCTRILDSAYQETMRAEGAEQQRDRLAHALGEVLAAFVHKVDGYRIPRRSAEADVVTLGKWRSILADNQGRP